MDTSPAAIKAWALSKAADIDNLSSEIRTWLGDDAGDEYEKDGKADDAPDAAMFRAVAALADLEAEAAAEIARLRVHEHELGELLAIIFRDGGHHQAAINDTHEAVREAIQIVAQDRARPGWREGVEAAAAVVDAECARVLATQYPDAQPGSFEDDVNRQTRMVAVMLPNVSEKIRALKEPT